MAAGAWLDRFVWLNAAGSVGVFLALQLLVFRRIAQEDCLKWMTILAAIAGTWCVAVGLSPLALRSVTGRLGVGAVVIAAGLSAFIYGLAVYLYALYVFGVAESSIRLRMLVEIAAAGPDGLTLAELFARYTERDIVHKRLERFLRSGDLIMRDDRLIPGRRVTLFTLQSGVIDWLRQWLGRPYQLVSPLASVHDERPSVAASSVDASAS